MQQFVLNDVKSDKNTAPPKNQHKAEISHDRLPLPLQVLQVEWHWWQVLDWLSW